MHSFPCILSEINETKASLYVPLTLAMQSCMQLSCPCLFVKKNNVSLLEFFLNSKTNDSS